MKSISLLLVILYIVFNVDSQELYNKQEFEILKLRIDTLDDTYKQLGISLRFDVKFKYPISSYTNNQYKISVVLKDENGKPIFNDTKSFTNTYAKPNYKNKDISIDKNVYLFIPLHQININEGKHNLLIELNAKNKNVEFGKIFSCNIEYDKPKLFDYSEQEFRIENFLAESGKRNGQKGISINFNCFYKFASLLIKNSDDDNSSKYYFFVSIYDKNKNLIFSPSEDINNYILTEYQSKIALSPNKKDDINIFISNRKLNLPEGNHKLKIILNVTNYKRNAVFKDIANGSVDITQEAFYIVKMNVSDLSIVYSDNYDVSNVFGQIFSKRSKNKGRGYPDILWKIKTGYDLVYSSGVVDNAFYGYSGSPVFRIIESDPISFDIYDFDKISRNDFIASYKIKHLKGNYNIELTDFRYKNIKNVNITFSKQKQPSILCKDILLSNNKVDKVSGVDISFSYITKNLSDNMKITPFIIDSSVVTRSINNFSQIIDDSIIFTPAIIINPANNLELIKIHIPYYEIKHGDNIGFKAELQELDMEIASIVSGDIIEIPKINDIGFKIISEEEEKHNGVFGVVFLSLFDIPSEYLKNIGKRNMVFETKLVNKQDNTNFIAYISNDITSDFYNKASSFNRFIPYYKLKDFTADINLKIIYSAKIKESDLLVGEGVKEFSIKNPDLQKVRISRFEMKYNTKKSNYKKVKLVIIHGEVVVYKSPVIEVSKKINLEDIKEILSHPKDDIVFMLIGFDDLMQETELWKNKIEASMLNNNTVYKLKAAKLVKKPKLILIK